MSAEIPSTTDEATACANKWLDNFLVSIDCCEPGDLHWTRDKKRIFPVILNPSYSGGIDIKPGECRVEYIIPPIGRSYKNICRKGIGNRDQYGAVPEDSLIPFNGARKMGEEWCETMLRQYMQQLRKSHPQFFKNYTIMNIAIPLFLRAVKDKCFQKQQQHLDLMNEIDAGSSPESERVKKSPTISTKTNHDDDNDELDMNNLWFLEDCREVLKPGDWIEYYRLVDGHVSKEILQINDPSRSPDSVIVVNDLYSIGRDADVRLVKRLLPNGCLERVNGVRRKVRKFILKCGGDGSGLAGILEAQADDAKDTRKRVRDNTQKKMKEDGTGIYSDLLH